jgi:hypothetical protein
MTFIRRQEEKLAIRFLQWRYQSQGLPLPSPADLKRQAAQIVDDAHRIARERGRNVVTILKDLANDIKDK